MTANLETRSSLIARITDVGDDEAWREFTAIYEPFIRRQALRFGLQEADAQELVQEVLIAVSKAVGRFQVDQSRGRFRTWLYAIGRNICLKHLARLRREQGSGDTQVRAALVALPDPSSLESEEFDIEFKRHVFLWVANSIRTEFRPKTWQAFWLSTVDNHSIERVSSELGISVGAVYIARSRVMARLRSRVQEITLEGVPDAIDLLRRASAVEENGSLEADSARERAG